MNKKLVLNVGQTRLNFLEKPDKANNDSDAKNALKVLFGKIFITKNTAKNIGSDYGFKKATAFDNSANYLGIVILRLKALNAIGLLKLQNKTGIIKKLSILFTMEPISIKTVV